MRTLRLFLYGIPAALLILLAAAFLNATFLSVAKKNEMSIGTLGEPSTLNPIQQADSASSQVGSLIFNGLIKYNQNSTCSPGPYNKGIRRRLILNLRNPTHRSSERTGVCSFRGIIPSPERRGASPNSVSTTRNR